MPTLIATQEALQHLAGNQSTQAPVSNPAPPVAEPVPYEPIQGTTPFNADNLPTAKRPASLSEEPAIFLTNVEMEAMFRRE